MDISEWCRLYAVGRPWFPFLLALLGTALVSATITHLFLPRNEASSYMASMLGMTSGIGLGAVVAMCFLLK